MKIALVILHADPGRGGAERYTIDLAAALTRRGHTVRVIATHFAAVPKGVAAVELPARGMTRSGRYRSFLDSLDAHFASNRYDVIHAMLPIRKCDIYHPHAGIAADAMQKTNRWLNPRRRLMADVERKLLTGPRAPIVVSLSNYSRADVERQYALAADRLVTLLNGVDLNRFSPMSQSGAIRNRADGDQPIALFIGKDVKRKGLDTALAAAAMMEGDQRPSIAAAAGRSSLRGLGMTVPPGVQVIAIGPMPDPRPLYADADFFLLPTRHDPCSLVVLEALAMGVPVISTSRNGATEVMMDGVHGYVLPDPEDATALADAIRKIMNADTRAAMRKALAELRPTLSFEHHLDRLIEFYQAVQKQ